MKKIYSLVATVIVAVGFNAQISVFAADFDNMQGSGGNDGIWTGSSVSLLQATTLPGFEFTNVYAADQCIRVGTETQPGSVTTPELSSLSGDAILSFKAGAWAGNGEKFKMNIAIIGGGSLNISTINLAQGVFFGYTVQITGGTPNSKIVFSSQSAKNRFFLDDIEVYKAGLGVNNTNTKKTAFVKNTLVENTISFAVTSDVKVVNMNGQIVKTASVSAKNPLDVAVLPKGQYVVTGMLNGRPVSQKIVKR
ncbi:T9SS type A sorting domain-containing protein [Chryseobacterium sp. SNU WT5]|uniref:T9SS type A sorting domain-containing protein n=1 Tax=Chryseobacterium sp. SNU WT5 TaxID=2594269 RepID=UPI00118095DF|nr:T9SS type A sorting domain-containing protein [Chryseobacterium sp. SNU WT5]QDP84377.1 T9SS type A sorting domain-containing protein [Chryseobacterium sp. SNU WT5]